MRSSSLGISGNLRQPIEYIVFKESCFYIRILCGFIETAKDARIKMNIKHAHHNTEPARSFFGSPTVTFHFYDYIYS